MTTLALAGDTMLGRKVGERLTDVGPTRLFDDEVVELTRSADVFVLNLECCISDRGERWPDPRKPFYFRAPPIAVEVLRHLGVDAVTLANNHALDFGEVALLDTLRRLEEAGIAHVGAGPHLAAARRPAVVTGDGLRLGVVGLTDHPEDFAAAPHRPGTAFAPLRRAGPPGWVGQAIAEVADGADAVLVTPHWGPNMTSEPVPHVRRAAAGLADHPVTLVAGHSAHVFHGVGSVEGAAGAVPVLFDLGDFIDDYAVDEELRNDLGLLWRVELDGEARVTRIAATPLHLDHCRTTIATGESRVRIERRFTAACRALGTDVEVDGDEMVVRRPTVD